MNTIEYKCDCNNCKLFDSNNYPEVYNIDFNAKELKVNEKTRQIKINHIRELFENIIENPIMGKYKIYYIKYPENMNLNAQNALLKVLEEPPKYAIILLVGENINILLPTIKSRCTKLYVFNKENEFCSFLKEDFEKSSNPFNLFYKDITNLNKYIFYDKYKKIFTRANYKNNLIFLEEGLSCFLEDKKFSFSKLYEIFIETNRRMERNCNFEMLTDFFLLKTWEMINENTI